MAHIRNTTQSILSRAAHRAVLTLAFWLVASFSATAQSAFVTDDFEIMFRAGPSVQNKIIRPLRSGTPIEVLREDAGNGHAQVQTREGEIGYVLARFVTDTQPARAQLQILQDRLDSLSVDPSGLRDQLVEAEESNRLLISENMRLTTQLADAQNTLDEVSEATGGAVELTEQNKQLNKEVQQLLLQLDDLRIQNDTLRDISEHRTMMIAAALVFTGLFLGWLLSMAGRRRHGSSW